MVPYADADDMTEIERRELARAGWIWDEPHRVWMRWPQYRDFYGLTDWHATEFIPGLRWHFEDPPA